MKPDVYVKNVLVTEAKDLSPMLERFSLKINARLLHGAIGLASELAEIREMALMSEDDTELDVTNLKEEMGDLYWYMGIMVSELGVNPFTVFAHDAVELVQMSKTDRLRCLNMVIDDMTIIIGTAIDMLKKTVIYGKELQVPALADQLLLLDYAIANALSLYGISPEQARQTNIDKLKARYGDKFTEAAALERDLVKEREILEKK